MKGVVNKGFWFYLRYVLKVLLILICCIVIGIYLYINTLKPSLNNNWSPDNEIMPQAIIDGDIIQINNVRNISYKTTSDYDVSYYNASYNLSELDSAWFLVEPFESAFSMAAHTLLTFGFKDKYVAISVEIRKKKGDSFSAIRGALNQYELMYVIADEQDVIKLRTNYRKDRVYLYRVNTTQEKLRALFVDMASRANKLGIEPEFYNTFTSTCTTNIVTHVNKISPRRVPMSLDILGPAQSDRLAYKIGLLNVSGTLEEARGENYITEKAQQWGNKSGFSEAIRAR